MGHVEETTGVAEGGQIQGTGKGLEKESLGIPAMVYSMRTLEMRLGSGTGSDRRLTQWIFMNQLPGFESSIGSPVTRNSAFRKPRPLPLKAQERRTSFLPSLSRRGPVWTDRMRFQALS